MSDKLLALESSAVSVACEGKQDMMKQNDR